MILLTTAKCIKCGGSAIADTFEQARNLINHAVGLSRGIKCGDSYNRVKEIKSKDTAKPKISKPVSETKTTETKITETKTTKTSKKKSSE